MNKLIVDNYDLIEKTDTLLEKLILVKRNSKVSKGGRVFGFSAITVVGDKNGKVGIGRGKAKEVPFAIQKAMDNAKKNMLQIKLKNGTIFHKITTKYCSTQIIMLPSSEGTGIISSFAIRSIFEALGIRNVLTKCFGSKNPNNLVKCVIKGLLKMSQSVEANAIRKKYIKKDENNVSK
jgi:small subunit ribosomal protein S5